MDWKKFEPADEEDLTVLRAVTLFLEGEDPFAEPVPIEGIAPEKCPDCGESMLILRKDDGTKCRGGCNDSARSGPM